MGLSATPFNDEKGAEYLYLTKRYKAELHDSNIATGAFDIPAPKLVNDCKSFFEQTTTSCAKLIYVQADQEPSVRELAKTFGYTEIETNCVDLNILKQIGKRVLIVTSDQQLLMRGVDYRSELIDLLILANFDNERAYRQALGRVGRFGDRCSRWMQEGLTGFDGKLYRKLKASLHYHALNGDWHQSESEEFHN